MADHYYSDFNNIRDNWISLLIEVFFSRISKRAYQTGVNKWLSNCQMPQTTLILLLPGHPKTPILYKRINPLKHEMAVNRFLSFFLSQMGLVFCWFKKSFLMDHQLSYWQNENLILRKDRKYSSTQRWGVFELKPRSRHFIIQNTFS